jgi:hypothetical protein
MTIAEIMLLEENIAKAIAEFEQLADQQAKRDAIMKPGIPFYIPKTTVDLAAYRSLEMYSIEQLLEYIGSLIALYKGFPQLAIQKKYDGVDIQIHRTDEGKITAFTEGFQDITDRIPSLIKLADKLFPKTSWIMIGELEGWKEDKHLGRDPIIGYINAIHTPVDDSNLTMSIFDLVWYQEKDIHKELYKNRFKFLQTDFNFKQSLLSKLRPGFNLAPVILVKDKKSLIKAVEKVSKPDESEGAVLKIWEGFKFNLNKRTKDMIKFKKFAEAHFTVLDKKLIQGSKETFQYQMGVLIDASYKGRVDKKNLQEYNGRDFIITGHTFNTNVKASVGDIITVKFSNVNVYFKGGMVSIGIYQPNVYENRSTSGKPEEPDSITSLLEVGRASGLLVEKSMGFFLSKNIEPYIQYPSESRNYMYVMQDHFRGKTGHTDFRIQHETSLIGYTLMNQVAGAIKSPVETLAEGRSYANDPHAWKFDPIRGKFQQRRTATGALREVSIQCALKGTNPEEWLHVEGVTREVGSTKNYPGVFVIVAQGRVEYGFREPYFHEYFVHNSKWPGRGLRLVFRLLSGHELSNEKYLYIPGLLDPLSETPNDFTVEDNYLIFNEGTIPIFGFEVDSSRKYLYKVLPPSEEPERVLPFVWLMVKPNSNEPYILSARARLKNKVPPPGISSMPIGIKSQIPKELQFWNKGSKSKDVLIELREAIKKKEIKLDYENTAVFRKDATPWVSKANSIPYVLKRRWWRGPIVVRLGSSATFWDLYYKNGSQWNHFVLMHNPVQYSEMAALHHEDVQQREVDHEGTIPPKTPLNPNSKIEAVTEKLGEGLVFFDVASGPGLHFSFNTGILKGKTFNVSRDEGSGIWQFSEIT